MPEIPLKDRVPHGVPPAETIQAIEDAGKVRIRPTRFRAMEMLVEQLQERVFECGVNSAKHDAKTLGLTTDQKEKAGREAVASVRAHLTHEIAKRIGHQGLRQEITDLVVEAFDAAEQRRRDEEESPF